MRKQSVERPQEGWGVQESRDHGGVVDTSHGNVGGPSGESIEGGTRASTGSMFQFGTGFGPGGSVSGGPCAPPHQHGSRFGVSTSM